MTSKSKQPGRRLALECTLAPDDEVRPPVALAWHGVHVRGDRRTRRVVEDVEVPSPPLREQELAVSRALTALLPAETTHLSGA